MTLDDLAAYGANVEEGLGRCMGMKDFYLGLVERVKTDGGFDKLRAAIDAGDYDAAFEAAHGLKGILANLALTPMLEPVEQVTEMLRPKQPVDCGALVDQIMDARERFLAL
jgi:HPt (histidine-containing phosphotransfer) domain-containing protein